MSALGQLSSSTVDHDSVSIASNEFDDFYFPQNMFSSRYDIGSCVADFQQDILDQNTLLQVPNGTDDVITEAERPSTPIAVSTHVQDDAIISMNDANNRVKENHDILLQVNNRMYWMMCIVGLFLALTVAGMGFAWHQKVENDLVKNEIFSLRMDMSSLKADYTEIVTDRNRWHQNASEAYLTMDRLNGELTDMIANNEVLQTKSLAIAEELSSTLHKFELFKASEYTPLKKKLEQVQKWNKQLIEEHEKLIKEKTNLDNNLIKLENENSNLKKEIELLKKEKNELKKNYNNLNNKYNDLLQNYRHLDGKMNDMQSENNRLKEELEAMKVQQQNESAVWALIKMVMAVGFVIACTVGFASSSKG